MSPLRVATGVLAWLVVVAVGSTLVWAVISRAGEGVVSSGDPVTATGQSSSTRTSKTSPSPSPSSPSASSPSPGSPSVPAPVRRTWQGPGGLVVAQCDGSAISRVSLLPDDGYQVQLEDDGPDQLVVEFEGREDESGSSASVRAACSGGIPVFDSKIDKGD